MLEQAGLARFRNLGRDADEAAGVAAVSLDELHAPRLSAAANATTAIETVFTNELLVY